MADSANETLSNEFFNTILDKDHVVRSWLLISTPFPVVSILLVYLLLVLKLGPDYMSTRRPFQLTSALRLHNLCQVICNGYMVYIFFTTKDLIPVLIRTTCSVEDRVEYEPLKQQYALYAWRLLVSKIMDLLDTVFMVLRKKQSHVTFLHVYHHGAMVFFVWFTLRFATTHQAIFPVIINVAVHIVMYGYYFLATFPGLKTYLWWKKYLTKLQLGQFIVVILYFCALYLLDCPISTTFTYIWLFNVAVIFVLFINFYIQAYVVNTTPKLNSHAKRS